MNVLTECKDASEECNLQHRREQEKQRTAEAQEENAVYMEDDVPTVELKDDVFDSFDGIESEE